MGKSAIGYGAALMATIVWAGNFVAARALAWAIPPCQFNFWRWAIAFLALAPFAAPHLKADWPAIRRHFAYLSLMGILGVTLMNTFVYKAGQTTESLNMALLMPVTPLIILILTRIFYGEAIPPRRLFGMLAAMAGILVLVSRGSLSALASLEIRSGDLWSMGCVVCFALYSLLMRQRPKDISPAAFNLAVFGLGLIYALPTVLIEIPLAGLPLMGAASWIGLLYSGLGCSALAFWLWTLGIDRIGPVKAGIVYYSLPLFAAIMGRIVLGETVSAAQMLGGCLIIAGIFTASLPIKTPNVGPKSTPRPPDVR